LTSPVLVNCTRTTLRNGIGTNEGNSRLVSLPCVGCCSIYKLKQILCGLLIIIVIDFLHKTSVPFCQFSHEYTCLGPWKEHRLLPLSSLWS